MNRYSLESLAGLGLAAALMMAAWPARPMSPALSRPPIVLVDPGHGGPDPGAVTPDGLLEKHVNLAIALDVAEALRQAGIGAVLTRSQDRAVLPGPRWDVEPDLKYRAQLVRVWHAALLVTIHANIESRGIVTGPIVYYAAGSSRSAALAWTVSQHLWATGGPAHSPRPIDQLVLSSVPVPAINVEVGFLSTPADAVRLASRSYQRQLGTAIAIGVADYLRHSPPSSSSTTAVAKMPSPRPTAPNLSVVVALMDSRSTGKPNGPARLFRMLPI